MSATRLEIKSRYREHPCIIAKLSDAECRFGEAMDAARLYDGQRYTLYCLDADNELAVFTALPAGVDLSAAPFMYPSAIRQR